MLACLGVRFCVRAGFRVFPNLAGLGFERVRVPSWAEVFAVGEIATLLVPWCILRLARWRACVFPCVFGTALSHVGWL